jgi:glycosyltransferase involved in cell wall biosynthesis
VSGRPLHLLEVGVRWPPETFIGWKLEGLAARGMRVTVASRSIFDPDLRLRGVGLVAIPPRRMGTATAIRILAREGSLALLRAPRRLARLLRGIRRYVPARFRGHYGGRLELLALYLPLVRMRPDIVHFEWNTTAVDYLPLFDVWGCPVVTSARGSDISVYPHVPGLEHYSTRLPYVLSRASAVHCVSECTRDEAAAFGLDPAKAWVVRPALDPEAFRPRPDNGRPAGGPLNVVMVAWLRWEKGWEYALEAIRALLDRGVAARLDIVGEVPEERGAWRGERQRILHTVTDLELQRHVRLYGAAVSADIARRLHGGDVFLHTSVTEGLPNAVLEAMACELPVVVTECGGLPEAVTDGVEGFVVAPRSPEQVADALARLSRDPGLRQRMGRAGRAKIRSGFTLEHEHGAFLTMYRQVART